MKYFFALAFFIVAPVRAENNARIISHLPPVAPNPIRFIPKAEFKNVLMHGYAKEFNYDPKIYLTHPSINSSFELSHLSTKSQTQFEAIRRDVVANRENFNVKNWSSFVQSLGSENGHVDIESLVFIVMMDATKSESEDLKSILEQVKKTNEIKSSLRAKEQSLLDLQNACGRTPTLCKLMSKKDIDSAKDAVKDKLDSMSEMGETESLRLQMAMDRMSKMMATLSNILKKMSDTSQGITQNMK